MCVVVFQKTLASLVNMEALRMEVGVCISFSKNIGFSRQYGSCQVETDICISFSENTGFSRKYGSCQMDTNVCSSLSKTFASLVNMEAVRWRRMYVVVFQKHLFLL
jgi:hypothetical protein